MKKILLILGMTAASVAFSQEQRAYDRDYTYTIKSEEVELNKSFIPVSPDPFPGPLPTPAPVPNPGPGPIVPPGPIGGPTNACDPSQPILPPWCNPGTGTGSIFPGVGGNPTIAILDQIVNLGLKIWQVVEKGKPVVNLNSKWATALPFGVNHWTQLQGWRNPKAAEFSVEAKNGFGAKIVSLKYRVIYSYAGNVNGIGQYLSNVKIVPIEMNVGWGYTLDLNVDVPEVLNEGTSEDPIAGMNVEVSVKISTTLKTSLMGQNLYISGSGSYLDLTNNVHNN